MHVPLATCAAPPVFQPVAPLPSHAEFTKRAAEASALRRRAAPAGAQPAMEAAAGGSGGAQTARELRARGRGASGSGQGQKRGGAGGETEGQQGSQAQQAAKRRRQDEQQSGPDMLQPTQVVVPAEPEPDDDAGQPGGEASGGAEGEALVLDLLPPTQLLGAEEELLLNFQTQL